MDQQRTKRQKNKPMARRAGNREREDTEKKNEVKIANKSIDRVQMDGETSEKTNGRVVMTRNNEIAAQSSLQKADRLETAAGDLCDRRENKKIQSLEK